MKAALIALLLIPGLALGDEIAAGDCAPMALEPVVLTHAADPLPLDGGVLIGWRHSSDWKTQFEGDPADRPEWRFKAGKRTLKPKRTTIAPGLVRYAVPTKVKLSKKGTKVRLDKVGTFVARRRAKAPKFTAAAPGVKSASVVTVQGRRGDRTTATVTLDAAPPADAYGLVLYQGGTAISWVAVLASTSTSFNVFESPGGCGMNPTGMRAPLTGDQIELAWVDSFGRLSPRSSSVTVK